MSSAPRSKKCIRIFWRGALPAAPWVLLSPFTSHFSLPPSVWPTSGVLLISRPSMSERFLTSLFPRRADLLDPLFVHAAGSRSSHRYQRRRSSHGRLLSEPIPGSIPGIDLSVWRRGLSRNRATPLGHLSIAQKIGDGAPLGMVFKDRKPTGEILTPNAPGRDPIVTRILWLKGLEAQNHNAFGRYIYIHGTPVENQIGKPASYGCIRMRSQDVVQLFTTVGVGTSVDVVADHLPVQPANIAQAVSAAPSMSSVRR